MNRIEARSRVDHVEGIVHGAFATVATAETVPMYAALGPDGTLAPETAEATRQAMLRAIATVDLAAFEAAALVPCRQLRAAFGPASVVAERAATLERWLGLLFDPTLRAVETPEALAVALQGVAGRVWEACLALREAIDAASDAAEPG